MKILFSGFLLLVGVNCWACISSIEYHSKVSIKMLDDGSITKSIVVGDILVLPKESISIESGEDVLTELALAEGSATKALKYFLVEKEGKFVLKEGEKVATFIAKEPPRARGVGGPGCGDYRKPSSIEKPKKVSK